jgi:YHS domain-containing protein
VNESQTLTDPVCGMSVTLASPHRRVHGGSMLCFCSARCLDLFSADPKRFASTALAREAARVPAEPRRDREPALPAAEPEAARPEATGPARAPSVPHPPILDDWEPTPAETLPTPQPLKFPVRPTHTGNAAPGTARPTATGWRERLESILPGREQRFVRRVSRELLDLYRTVSARNSRLQGRDLYREIVIARKGADAGTAETLLDQAEESYALWPTPRALTFCDVVHFIAVSEFLASHDDTPWIHENVRREVDLLIPHNL